MAEASSNLTGADGELVDFLCQALERMGERDLNWLRTVLLTLSVDLGVAFTSTEKHFNAAESLVLFRNRLLFLARQGLLESFVVLAARESVSAGMRAFADMRGVNERREEIGQAFSELCRDPDRFRDFFRRRDPDCEQASWPDDRILEEGDKYLHLFEPIQVDKVADIWEMASHWSDVSSQLVPDDTLNQWRRLNLPRRS